MEQNKKKRGRPRKIKFEEENKKEKNTEFIDFLIEEKNEDIKNDDDNDVNEFNQEDFLKEFNNIEPKEPNEEHIEDDDDNEPKFYREENENLNKLPTDFKNEFIKIYKNKNNYDFDSLYDEENPSVVLGKNRRELLTKIKQYKELFKNELANFRIKKNANENQLQDYLNEMESIVSTSSVEGFVSNSIFQSIQIIEGISARYENYDITGTAECLRKNPEFNKLLKILMIKYKVFNQIPAEYQLIFIVVSTSLVMRTKNKLEKQRLNQEQY